ncbi:MAG: hypothetical protein GY696_28310 [Gammaproteobacteria bacterium]|nr:hypothetical protein [Gammaproteobacteria bacterium]
MASKEGRPLTPLSVITRTRLFGQRTRDPTKRPAKLRENPAAQLEDPTIAPRGEVSAAKGGGEGSRSFT